LSLRERILLANKHCVFISIPKNASISLKEGIENIEKIWWLGDVRARILEMRNNRLSSRSNLLCIRLMNELQEKWDKLFTFTVIRNPWDRFISSWLYINRSYKKEHSLLELIEITEEKRKKKEYDDYIGWHISGQLENLSDNSGNFVIDKIIKFENLQIDFDELLISIGEKPVILPHRHKAKREYYAKYYNEETKKRVYQLYKDDIDFFGFKFEE
jgi:chondroitin 4-sulfotransferase 11